MAIQVTKIFPMGNLEIDNTPVLTDFNTCIINACGEWTKNGGFPFGAHCKHNWPSVATGLYMKTIEFDKRPS